MKNNYSNKRELISKIFIYVVFVFYILLLIKILFLSRISLSELFNNQRIVNRSINLVPFKSISAYLFGSLDEVKRFAFGNVAGNIITFIPLGLYLPFLKKDKRVWINLLIVFLVSLLTEIIQGVLAIGASDIDDIILNCLGGLAGISGYRLLLVILKSDKKVCTAVTILSAIGLPVILYLLFMIQMAY